MPLLAITICLLILFLGQAIYSRLTWDRDLGVQIEFARNTATEGDTISIRERVHNYKKRPVTSLKVSLNLDKNLMIENQENSFLSDRNYQTETFSLKARSEVTREIECFCMRRGFYSIDEVVLVSSDLFYTQRFVRRVPQNSKLYVFPGSVYLPLLQVAAEQILGDLVTYRRLMEDPFEFRGVRDYVITDPLRSINWKMSARTGELQVNVLEHTANSEVRIVLDLVSDQMIQMESMSEESIRIAAALADSLIEKGVSTSIISNGRDIVTGTPLQIEAGSGDGHSENIRSGLARLNTECNENTKSVIELLEDTADDIRKSTTQISCLLISSEINEELAGYWEDFTRADGIHWWIQPSHTREDKPSGEWINNRMYWRVPYGK